MSTKPIAKKGTCNFCKEKILGKIVTCINCGADYHSYCLFEMPNVIILGKNNAIKCCSIDKLDNKDDGKKEKSEQKVKTRKSPLAKLREKMKEDKEEEAQYKGRQRDDYTTEMEPIWVAYDRYTKQLMLRNKDTKDAALKSGIGEVEPVWSTYEKYSKELPSKTAARNENLFEEKPKKEKKSKVKKRDVAEEAKQPLPESKSQFRPELFVLVPEKGLIEKDEEEIKLEEDSEDWVSKPEDVKLEEESKQEEGKVEEESKQEEKKQEEEIKEEESKEKVEESTSYETFPKPILEKSEEYIEELQNQISSTPSESFDKLIYGTKLKGVKSIDHPVEKQVIDESTSYHAFPEIQQIPTRDVDDSELRNKPNQIFSNWSELTKPIEPYTFQTEDTYTSASELLGTISLNQSGEEIVQKSILYDKIPELTDAPSKTETDATAEVTSKPEVKKMRTIFQGKPKPEPPEDIKTDKDARYVPVPQPIIMGETDMKRITFPKDTKTKPPTEPGDLEPTLKEPTRPSSRERQSLRSILSKSKAKYENVLAKARDDKGKKAVTIMTQTPSDIDEIASETGYAKPSSKLGPGKKDIYDSESVPTILKSIEDYQSKQEKASNVLQIKFNKASIQGENIIEKIKYLQAQTSRVDEGTQCMETVEEDITEDKLEECHEKCYQSSKDLIEGLHISKGNLISSSVQTNIDEIGTSKFIQGIDYDAEVVNEANSDLKPPNNVNETTTTEAGVGCTQSLGSNITNESQSKYDTNTQTGVFEHVHKIPSAQRAEGINKETASTQTIDLEVDQKLTKEIGNNIYKETASTQTIEPTDECYKQICPQINKETVSTQTTRFESDEILSSPPPKLELKQSDYHPKLVNVATETDEFDVIGNKDFTSRSVNLEDKPVSNLKQSLKPTESVPKKESPQPHDVTKEGEATYITKGIEDSYGKPAIQNMEDNTPTSRFDDRPAIPTTYNLNEEPAPNREDERSSEIPTAQNVALRQTDAANKESLPISGTDSGRPLTHTPAVVEETSKIPAAQNLALKQPENLPVPTTESGIPLTQIINGIVYIPTVVLDGTTKVPITLKQIDAASQETDRIPAAASEGSPAVPTAPKLTKEVVEDSSEMVPRPLDTPATEIGDISHDLTLKQPDTTSKKQDVSPLTTKKLSLKESDNKENSSTQTVYVRKQKVVNLDDFVVEIKDIVQAELKYWRQFIPDKSSETGSHKQPNEYFQPLTKCIMENSPQESNTHEIKSIIIEAESNITSKMREIVQEELKNYENLGRYISMENQPKCGEQLSKFVLELIPKILHTGNIQISPNPNEISRHLLELYDKIQRDQTEVEANQEGPPIINVIKSATQGAESKVDPSTQTDINELTSQVLNMYKKLAKDQIESSENKSQVLPVYETLLRQKKNSTESLEKIPNTGLSNQIDTNELGANLLQILLKDQREKVPETQDKDNKTKNKPNLNQRLITTQTNQEDLLNFEQISRRESGTDTNTSPDQANINELAVQVLNIYQNLLKDQTAQELLQEFQVDPNNQPESNDLTGNLHQKSPKGQAEKAKPQANIPVSNNQPGLEEITSKLYQKLPKAQTTSTEQNQDPNGTESDITTLIRRIVQEELKTSQMDVREEPLESQLLEKKDLGLSNQDPDTIAEVVLKKFIEKEKKENNIIKYIEDTLNKENCLKCSYLPELAQELEGSVSQSKPRPGPNTSTVQPKITPRTSAEECIKCQEEIDSKLKNMQLVMSTEMSGQPNVENLIRQIVQEELENYEAVSRHIYLEYLKNI